MCRWLAYRGEPLFLEDLIAAPKHSLIAQSLSCREAPKNTNGDGFGIAWYDRRAEPGIYRETFPAWSNENLRNLCHHLRSGLFLAHVRAATGTATILPNCHPFAVGKMSFMHNGQIENFGVVRRQLEAMVPDALYKYREGTTDSEVLFLLMLAQGLETNPLEATERALFLVESVLKRNHLPVSVRFSAAFSDGHTIYAVRYSSDAITPTLYYKKTPTGAIVVSEPLDDEPNYWTPVSKQQALCIAPDGLSLHDFNPHRVAHVLEEAR